VSGDGPTLYSRALLDLARAPRHTGKLAEPAQVARVDNALCGDRVTLHVRVKDGVLVSVAHQTRGCALCIASASVMAEAVMAESVETAERRAVSVVAELAPLCLELPVLTDPAMALFDGVRGMPGRRGCVALPWQALREVLGSTGG